MTGPIKNQQMLPFDARCACVSLLAETRCSIGKSECSWDWKGEGRGKGRVDSAVKSPKPWRKNTCNSRRGSLRFIIFDIWSPMGGFKRRVAEKRRGWEGV